MKNKLFCDLKTNQEKLEFFRAGRGYDTGIVAKALQEELITVYSQLVALESRHIDVQRSKIVCGNIVRDIKEAVENISWTVSSCKTVFNGCTNTRGVPNYFHIEIRDSNVLFVSNKDVFLFDLWHEEGKDSISVFLEYDDELYLKEAKGICMDEVRGYALLGQDEPLIYPPAYYALCVIRKVFEEAKMTINTEKT